MRDWRSSLDNRQIERMDLTMLAASNALLAAASWRAAEWCTHEVYDPRIRNDSAGIALNRTFSGAMSLLDQGRGLCYWIASP
jgi:hypothetical protein